MSHEGATPTISRRLAVAGLGAGGFGAALAATGHAAAQDAAAATATHAIVGLWQNAASGPPAMKDPWTLCVFHGDGTYSEWDGLNAGAALGIWRPAGDRAADLVSIFQETVPRELTESPGSAAFRMTVTLDDTGDVASFAGEIVVRSPEGYPIVTLPDAQWTAARVTFDRNPSTENTVATPPAS